MGRSLALDYLFANVEDAMKEIGVVVSFDPVPLLHFSRHHHAYLSVATRTGSLFFRQSQRGMRTRGRPCMLQHAMESEASGAWAWPLPTQGVSNSHQALYGLTVFGQLCG
jgi:hypothetical protein